MKLRIQLSLVLFLAFLFASCQDDESWRAAYISDLCEISTDSEGWATQLRLDNGQAYPVSWKTPFEKGDTIYRCAAIYTLEEGRLTLSSCQQIFSLAPAKQMPHPFLADPCQIESIWIAGNYLNARLLIQGKDAPHYLNIIESGIKNNPDGSQKLTLLLYHNQNNDMAAFTLTEYISCKLDGYSGQLKSGRDTIEFVAPQKTYELPY